jgi:hypothetical protein
MEHLIGAAMGMLIGRMGRLAIWLVSFGRWRGERTLDNEGRIFGAAGALSFVREGQRVITETGLLLAGTAFATALVILALTVAAMR